MKLIGTYDMMLNALLDASLFYGFICITFMLVIRVLLMDALLRMI